MELLDIVAAIAIGTLLGFGIVGMYVWYLWNKIKRHVDHMIEQVVQEAEANIVGLDIELDKGVYFCYNSADKQFICQGATVGEIAVAFRARYPGKTAYLAGGDEEVVAYFKTELLKLATDEPNNNV
jgi:hypothetical protein